MHEYLSSSAYEVHACTLYGMNDLSRCLSLTEHYKQHRIANGTGITCTVQTQTEMNERAWLQNSVATLYQHLPLHARAPDVVGRPPSVR